MKKKDIEIEIERLKKNPNLPAHIAIIMDGNGRWAKRRHLPRIAGHRVGRESVRTAVRTCAKLGIEALSLYTFSLENWHRPKKEVDALMRFLKDVLHSEYLELKENNIRLTASGRLEMLPEATMQTLKETMEKLSDNTGMILNLCLSYSGRAEILDAVKGITVDVEKGKLSAEEIDEDVFRRYLYLPELPYPDLLIRTGREFRVSNFFLWQIAYTEIVVMDVLWPDFREANLFEAITEYLGRERRFGRVRAKR
ncbi:MAG: hypothetical protein B6D63_06855 [Candidatus Latescibacteria bacterium 4484_7]|nr:MAG: hypothetical protein B6D63_06855 [Candidatus Latescibacteria bacterium 4484_7]